MSEDRSANRNRLVERLQEDLIGPRATDEVLSARPSDVYLTGILWPNRSRADQEDDERLGLAGAAAQNDGEDGEDGGVPASSVQKPSVMGLSFAFQSLGQSAVLIDCSFARYRLSKEENQKFWVREEIRLEGIEMDLADGSSSRDLGNLDARAHGVRIHLRVIQSDSAGLATISLMNLADTGEGRDELEAALLFQAEIAVRPGGGTELVPRPAATGRLSESSDADDRSNALLFRNVVDFATGHTCSARWPDAVAGELSRKAVPFVKTTWIPDHVVPDVSSAGHVVFEPLVSQGRTSARFLAECGVEELQRSLGTFVAAYSDWIDLQDEKLASLVEPFSSIARDNLNECRRVCARMGETVNRLEDDPRLRESFQLANLVMATQFEWSGTEEAVSDLVWRPFQLGFLLLSVPSTIDCSHRDRAEMDLLWFPTGGGKTEAYLALIALLAIHQRLCPATERREGVVALMRYTLRLLTTQQFARAAAMIFACEALRTGRLKPAGGKVDLGERPFSIGLWVGGDATPNKLPTAHLSLQGSVDVASPKQLAKCPCCHNALVWRQASPRSAVIASCDNQTCLLSGQLPVWTVDEDVYDQRPTLLIGTIDKFAQIVRRPEIRGLFGIDVAKPPSLIIQDELHLISGPLGTIAGLYEAALDLLFSAGGMPPKVIGSTATIRRANEQVRDLFARTTCQFPPPAVDYQDSGFAVLKPDSVGRRYVGITTAGRSAKFTLQAVSASLLQSASAAFADDGERDPYSTLVGYFNSLRELGGALVLMQDDVGDSIKLYAEARDEKSRAMENVEELTSRRTQEEILQMLSTMAIPAGRPGSPDAVLATNMVSVGVDISRLGLMVVNGQPKTIAEYIQSTSRVGRGGTHGLVVAILNNAKARDRSHFETFCGWHQRLYRDVEATSVTPFASRARDRALHAALIASVRHLVPGMLTSPELDDKKKRAIEEIIGWIAGRAKLVDESETAVEKELLRLLENWETRAPEEYWNDWKSKKSLVQSAERAARLRALGRRAGSAWPTMNSMRNVETASPFRMASALRREDR